MCALLFVLLFLGGCAGASKPAVAPEWPGEARKARLENEIEDAGPSHPWAGSYYQGDGLGTNESLLLAPSGEYFFQTSGCTSFPPAEEGKIREEGGLLHFEGAASNEMTGKSYRIVPWGDRVYLISEGSLVSFANEINLGSEPRYGSHGFYFMRSGGEERIATGKPGVPKEILPFLLDRPIDAAIISLGSSTVSTAPYTSHDFKTPVTLDAGRRDGLLPGMELHVRGKMTGEAEVLSVEAGTSTALLSSYEKPQAEWRLSTRWDFMRGLSPTDQPYRIKVTTMTAAIYPSVRENPKPLHEDDTNVFPDAAQNGFSVAEAARIEYSAADRDLSGGKIFYEKVGEVLMRLGANAYYVPFRLSRDEDPAPWSHVQQIIAYRIEHDGRLVSPGDLEEAPDPDHHYRLNWPMTRAAMLLHANTYDRESHRVREEVFCGIFKLTPEQCAGWSSLKFTELSADQLETFAEHWGSRGKSGLVASARPEKDAKWEAFYEGEVEPRLKAVQAEDSKAYAEYQRLWAIMYPKDP